MDLLVSRVSACVFGLYYLLFWGLYTLITAYNKSSFFSVLLLLILSSLFPNIAFPSLLISPLHDQGVYADIVKTRVPAHARR